MAKVYPCIIELLAEFLLFLGINDDGSVEKFLKNFCFSTKYNMKRGIFGIQCELVANGRDYLNV